MTTLQALPVPTGTEVEPGSGTVIVMTYDNDPTQTDQTDDRLTERRDELGDASDAPDAAGRGDSTLDREGRAIDTPESTGDADGGAIDGGIGGPNLGRAELPSM